MSSVTVKIVSVLSNCHGLSLSIKQIDLARVESHLCLCIIDVFATKVASFELADLMSASPDSLGILECCDFGSNPQISAPT